MEPATWAGACSSDCLSLPSREYVLEYELEKFAQSMQQGTKMAIPLRPPSSGHWNIESDLILTIMTDTY